MKEMKESKEKTSADCSVNLYLNINFNVNNVYSFLPSFHELQIILNSELKKGLTTDTKENLKNTKTRFIFSLTVDRNVP